VTPDPLQLTLLEITYQRYDLVLAVLFLPSNKFENDAIGSMFLGLVAMIKHTLTLASYAPYHF